jgi:small-conductance mechanosensitive channel
VRIADTMGDVVQKSLLVTRVRTPKNVVVAIPNSLVLGAQILNYSAMAQGEGLVLHTSVTIGYDAPWRQIHDLLISAALATPGILGEPRPFVLQTALNDFYVHYEVNAYTRDPGRMLGLYSDLHANIQDTFYKAGVEIMSPHVSMLRDGNKTAMPDTYLGDAYEPGAFRVRRVGE